MMGPMRRYAPLLLASVLLGACRTDEVGPTGVGYMSLSADQLLIDVTQMLNTSGVQTVELRADSVYVYNDSARADMRVVNVTMYDEEGRVRTTVVAESGQIHQVTEAMVARGNVVIVADYGERRIETEELHYEPQMNRIWSDVPFVMVHEGSTTRGASFRSDTQFQNFQATDFSGRIPGLRFQF
jgi:LPS export ABC transporter protein LptC